ncbi:MAG TPA: Hsp70 family protein [Polyangia bacterium]
MAVLGIDLGTTNSVVACVRSGDVVIVPDKQGHRLHPSVVALLADGGRLFSHEAASRRLLDPRHTIYSAKRLMGQPFASEETVKTAARIPYEIQQGNNEQVVVVGPDRPYTIPEISGLFLGYLRQCAQTHLNDEITGAVITVPANFNNAQRQATMDAGRIAGIDVLRVINEPTAAALAYGLGRGISQRIAVYDFGGGTFDVTVLQVEGEMFEVLASGGDSFLGGDDVDEAVLGLLAAQFAQQHGYDPREDRAMRGPLLLSAEKIKRHLTGSDSAEGGVSLTADDNGDPLEMTFNIKRAALEAAIAPLIGKTLAVCDEVLASAKLSASQIDDVIMVGGSTRIPAVRKAVERHFGRPPRTDINPDEVVAVGAAVQAASLAGGGMAMSHRPILLDVTPRALGIAVAGGFAEPIVERNVPVPVEQTRVFSTSTDGQTKVIIQVCQGESRRFHENVALGELTLKGLRAGGRGEVKIEVTFKVDTNGILRVRARDPETDLATEAAVSVRGTMTEGEVDAAAGRHSGFTGELPAVADAQEA